MVRKHSKQGETQSITIKVKKKKHKTKMFTLCSPIQNSAWTPNYINKISEGDYGHTNKKEVVKASLLSDDRIL